MEYRVTWEIDINADSPREAAEKALAIHRNPESTATVFEVCHMRPGPLNSHTIDLSCEHLDATFTRCGDDSGMVRGDCPDCGESVLLVRS